ncbi:hypothetical protein A6A04_05290 [Paramagnetospirillum marisnigri]|uniref:DUF4136 domain-containing protein n=1 Tax=Paramagnetospirillum marisnigri TaxID=1285242 RepID=A0A178MHL7_9PROT|nr:hypothetical protein [Paramagnetospirillum marisnigri]OAN48166.1 hypothetical protein A6A04_05290 [Paramagnetospirillum marisnigri]
MIKRFLSLGAAALATLVSGCGDGPSTVPGTYRSPATWSSFIYATSSGPLLLDLRGDPFGGGAATLARAVSTAVAGAVPGRPFQVTLDPASAAQAKYRIVMILGAAAGADERAACAGGAKGGSAPVGQGRLEVVASFCEGDAPLSSSRGWVARLDGPDDRRFGLLIGQLARDLIGQPP